MKENLHDLPHQYLFIKIFVFNTPECKGKQSLFSVGGSEGRKNNFSSAVWHMFQ